MEAYNSFGLLYSHSQWLFNNYGNKSCKGGYKQNCDKSWGTEWTPKALSKEIKRGLFILFLALVLNNH